MGGLTDKELRKANNKLRVLAWHYESRCNRYKELKNEIKELADEYGDRRYSKNNMEMYNDLMMIVDKMERIDYDPHDKSEVQA